MSVHTSLGGGTHRHLGMDYKPAAYADINGTKPYERPEIPVVLEIKGGTVFEIAQQKAEHKEATHLFCRVLGVEQSLIQQIIGAIDNNFLQALRIPITSKIDKTIPAIFEYLYRNFGNVIHGNLSDLKDKTKKTSFDVKEPLDTVFTVVDNVADIARIAKSPLSDQ